jgi:hypothetical protein
MFFAAVHVYHTCQAVEILAVVIRADVIRVVDLLLAKNETAGIDLSGF